MFAFGHLSVSLSLSTTYLYSSAYVDKLPDLGAVAVCPVQLFWELVYQSMHVPQPSPLPLEITQTRYTQKPSSSSNGHTSPHFSTSLRSSAFSRFSCPSTVRLSFGASLLKGVGKSWLEQ